jgi:hypothetical protein
MDRGRKGGREVDTAPIIRECEGHTGGAASL